jgi:preprotein translocase subunit SecG
MLLGILLVFQVVVSLALIGVVLLQRSEGGALGMGGGPSGFMTARGAGDLLTRTTWILAAIFFSLSLALTLLSGRDRAGGSVVDRLKVDAINPATLQQQTPQPAQGQPQQGRPAPSPFQAPLPSTNNPFLGGAPAPQPAPQPAQPAGR